MNFDLLNQVLRFEIFLHRDGQLHAVHVILGFKPISNRFQVSKHVIKARDSRLALVNMAVEGFISKPPPEGTQLVELPTFKDPQPIVEEITSSDAKAEIEFEDNTKNPIRDEDFEVFYHINETKEEGLSPHPAAALVSKDQETTEVPEGMVIEKRLPDLVSLLESHVGTTAPEVPIIPRPPTPIPLASVQIEPVDKK